MHRPTMALALAAGAFALASPAAAQDEATVSLPALSVNFSPNYIAHDAGLWKAAGIDVKLTQISGIGSMNAMLSGSVEFSNSSVATVIRANIRGQKVLAIGTALEGIAQEIVLGNAAAKAAGVTETSPMVERARALKGKRLSVDSPNTLPHAFIRYIARKGGLDPERDITVASMQPEAATAALKSGAIDGMAGGMPPTVRAVQEKLGILLASGIRGDVPELMPVSNNVIVTRPDTCEKRASLCTKLMDGYNRAVAFMHDKPKESIDILAKRMPGMDRETLELSYERLLKWTPKSTRMSEANFANIQKFMIAGGMLKAEEAMSSFGAIYTEKFAR